MVRRSYWQRATPRRGRRSGTKRKVQPLPVTPGDFLRAEEILTLAILAAMSRARVGEYCPFGEIVVTLEHGKPTNVRFERNVKPNKIKPEPGITQE